MAILQGPEKSVSDLRDNAVDKMFETFKTVKESQDAAKKAQLEHLDTINKTNLESLQKAITTGGDAIQIDPATGKVFSSKDHPELDTIVKSSQKGLMDLQQKRIETLFEKGMVPSIAKDGSVSFKPKPVNAYSEFAKEMATPIANSAKNGDMTPYLNSDRRTKTAVGALLAKEGVDASKLESDYRTLMSKARTAGSGQAMRFETAATSLDQGLTELDRLSDQYSRSNILPTIANKIKISSDKEGIPVFSLDKSGLSPDAQEQAIQYVSQLNFSKDQLALVFSGGYAPQEWAYKMAVENINPYFGNRGMKAATGQARKEIQYRINALNQFYGKKQVSDIKQTDTSNQVDPIAAEIARRASLKKGK